MDKNSIFAKKIKEIHSKGFNISMMINQFRKESKLSIEIPEEVILNVCNSFDKYKPIKPYPYFKKVLKGECEKHCIQLQKDACKTGKTNKDGIDKIRELIKGIKI